MHKVTIIPRGRALGVTMSLPEKDRYSYSKLELVSKLAVMYGGRIAEELIFGVDNVTTGAGNDIQQATEMARRMVTEYGFSEELGPLRYSDNEEEVFLGHSVARSKNVSDETAALIDKEVRRLIEEAEASAREILTDKSGDLEAVALALLEYETLSGDEVASLLRGSPSFGLTRMMSRREAARGPRYRPAEPQRRSIRKIRPPAVEWDLSLSQRVSSGQGLVSASRLIHTEKCRMVSHHEFRWPGFIAPPHHGDNQCYPRQFADAGETFDHSQAIDRGLQHINEGADIIDVGGESTRPGAASVSVEEECRRILPVVEALVGAMFQCLSTHAMLKS